VRVLVTGASGWLGGRVVGMLLEAGASVTAGVRAPTGQSAEPNQAGQLREIPVDVVDADRVAHAVDAVDVVVHCAAYGAKPEQGDVRRMFEVNVMGTALVHEAVRRRGIRMVHVGSAMEYGESRTPVDEATPLLPLGSYAVSKAASSLLVLGVPSEACVLRLFNLFGGGDRTGRLAAAILRGARDGRPIALSHGAQRRDFLHVDDAARAIASVALCPAGAFPARRALNVCSGTPKTVKEFATEMADALGVRDLLRFGAIPEREGTPSDLWGLPTAWEAFCREIGVTWQPTPVAVAVAAEGAAG